MAGAQVLPSGRAILSIFGGGKITCAIVLSHESTRVNLIWSVSSTAVVNVMIVQLFVVVAISVGSARSA